MTTPTQAQIEAALPEDHPLMIDWKAYRATQEFANTIKWAGENQIGSLWAAFASGWGAARRNLKDEP